MATDPSIVTVTLNPAIDRTLFIDGFRAGQVNRVDSEHVQAAGKGVNVATMLADLGRAVTVTGYLGEKNGAAFDALFAHKKLEDRFVRIDGETRVGLKIVSDGETTDINFPGATPSAAAVAKFRTQFSALILPKRWFVIAGSLPAGIGAEQYAQMIQQIRAAGAQALLDTSGAALTPALWAVPDVVKPNIDELSAVAGVQLESVDAVVRTARSRLIEKGIGLAVISMGGDGAVFVTRDRAFVATPPKVEVKSTVGAGDAMVAGIVHGLSMGWSLEDTAALASSLGTYAVTRLGSGLEPGVDYRRFGPTIRSL